jgi:hypothetical protein
MCAASELLGQLPFQLTSTATNILMHPCLCSRDTAVNKSNRTPIVLVVLLRANNKAKKAVQRAIRATCGFKQQKVTE